MWGSRWKMNDGCCMCERPFNTSMRYIADVHDVDRSDWLYVEDLSGELRWIHRDRVIEIRQPYWMDVEHFTVTQLDHPSNGQGLGERGVPLREGL